MNQRAPKISACVQVEKLEESSALEESNAHSEEKAEKISKATPFKQFESAPEDHPWNPDESIARLSQLTSLDGTGNHQTVNVEEFAKFFLYADVELKKFALPVVDVVDRQPKVVLEALLKSGEFLQGEGSLEGYEFDSEERASMLERVKQHLEAFGATLPEPQEKAQSPDLRIGQFELITDTVEQTKFPPSAVPNVVENVTDPTAQEDKQGQISSLVHPEFKEQCAEVAALLFQSASEIMEGVQALEVIDMITLAEVEQGQGFRMGRLNLWELPTELSSKIAQTSALMSRLQEKIPASMRVEKFVNPSPSDEQVQEDRQDKASPVEKQEKSDLENKALKRELDAVKHLLKKRGRLGTCEINKSQALNGSPSQMKVDEEDDVSWAPDMAAERDKNLKRSN